jgi:hypothetical protein
MSLKFLIILCRTYLLLHRKLLIFFSKTEPYLRNTKKMLKSLIIFTAKKRTPNFLIPVYSVVDPDSLNPDTDPDPAFQVNSDPVPNPNSALKTRTSSTSKHEIY